MKAVNTAVKAVVVSLAVSAVAALTGCTTHAHLDQTEVQAQVAAYETAVNQNGQGYPTNAVQTRPW